MGLLGATFKIASNVNDIIPFTPQTRDIYDKASEYDVLKILSEYTIDNETGSLSESGENSTTLVNSSNLYEMNENAIKVNKIKEKLILYRRTKIAITDGDEQFNADNIMRHDNSPLKLSPIPASPSMSSKTASEHNHNGSTPSDYDYSDDEEDQETEFNFEETIDDALSYLTKSLTNDRVKYDDELFEQFFSNSMVLIINYVSITRPNFLFKKILDSLNKSLKFYILKNYLMDDDLIDEFKDQFKQFQNHHHQTSPVIEGSTRFSTEQVLTRTSQYRSDQLTLRIIQLTITLSFRFCKFFCSVIFPLIQMMWIGFLELNDNYQIINRISDMIISFFSLLIDQLFLFVDNGEKFDFTNNGEPSIQSSSHNSGFFKPSNRAYFNMLKTLLRDKLSARVDREQRKYKFEATSTPT